MISVIKQDAPDSRRPVSESWYSVCLNNIVNFESPDKRGWISDPSSLREYHIAWGEYFFKGTQKCDNSFRFQPFPIGQVNLTLDIISIGKGNCLEAS